MAKYSCELDSETGDHKFYIDGQEVPADEFSISCYQFSDSQDPTKVYNSYYVSAGQVDGQKRWSHSVNWDSRTNSVSTSDSYTSISSAIKKAVSQAWASAKVIDSIAAIRRKNV